MFTSLCISSSTWQTINKEDSGQKKRTKKNEQQQEKYLVKYQSNVMNCGSAIIIGWNSKNT